jgi:hypothetical protein
MAWVICLFCKKYHVFCRNPLILKGLQLGSLNPPLWVRFCHYGRCQKGGIKTAKMAAAPAFFVVSRYLATVYVKLFGSVQKYPANSARFNVPAANSPNPFGYFAARHNMQRFCIIWHPRHNQAHFGKIADYFGNAHFSSLITSW